MILEAMLDHRAWFLFAVTAVPGIAAVGVWAWRRARGRSDTRDGE